MKTLVDRIFKTDPLVTMWVSHVYAGRHTRETNPDGAFDRQGRWHPSVTEEVPGSFGVRRPTRAWPYSYLTHARTKEHVRRVARTYLAQPNRILPRDMRALAPVRAVAFARLLLPDDLRLYAEPRGLLLAALAAGEDVLPWLALADNLAERGYERQAEWIIADLAHEPAATAAG